MPTFDASVAAEIGARHRGTVEKRLPEKEIVHTKEIDGAHSFTPNESKHTGSLAASSQC